MYSNAGKSIKSYVKVVVSIAICICILLGILVIAITEDFLGVLLGLLIAGVGSFMAWLSGLVLYAFGDIAERVANIDEKLSGNVQSADVQKGTDDQAAAIDWEKEPQWECYNCGTSNPMQRAYCLKCNTSRDWSLKKSK